ncbi:MAG: hypothetical protein ACT4OX_10090 [Actinomycetota bacterium]
MEWDAGDATLRTPAGWHAIDAETLTEDPVDFAIEASDGAALASLTVDETPRPLEELEAEYRARLLVSGRNFDQDGAVLPVTIPRADGALLMIARFDRRFDTSDSGPAVAAFVTAKKGHNAFFFAATAKDQPGNEELVEAIARSLAIK